MSWLLPLVVGIVLFFVTLGVIGTAIYFLRQSKKVDVEPNAPLINTAMRKEFTEGHTLGVIKTIRQNKNNTHFIEVYPIDKRQGVGEILPKKYGFVVADELLQNYARGEYSDYREFIKILPRSNADLPKKMRDDARDLEASFETKQGQVSYLMKQLKPALITSGDEAITEMLKTLTRTGISQKTMSQLQEEIAQFRKMQVPLEKKDTEEKK